MNAKNRLLSKQFDYFGPLAEARISSLADCFGHIDIWQLHWGSAKTYYEMKTIAAEPTRKGGRVLSVLAVFIRLIRRPAAIERIA